MKRGSITLTDSIITIAFRRNVEAIESLGQVGIDVNERNVTWSDTQGKTEQLNISEVAEIRERYKAIRAEIAQRTQKDRRVQQRLLSKYGKREKERTAHRIHQVTKKVVEHARKNKLGIVMEKLKGIRKLYRKGNFQGRSFRGRLNSWSFREIQRQVEYKASWEGIPVRYVNARGTSRNCLCGSRMEELEGRRMRCPSCGREWDGDVIASKNIMAAPLVRAARPSACSDEGGTRR
ncbi:MAG: transposase [Thaumarchaeota archaeon]|nr:transposase [Nitrososphaerota archaeon]